MDLKGSLVDSNLRIVPSKNLIDFLKTINISKDVPSNIAHIIKGENKCEVIPVENVDTNVIQLTDEDFKVLRIVKDTKKHSEKKSNPDKESDKDVKENDKEHAVGTDVKPVDKNSNKDGSKDDIGNDDGSGDEEENKSNEEEVGQFLTTADLDWLYLYIKNKRSKDQKIPYLHELLEGVDIKIPPNKVLKRNPDLEARCVKLRAQQEAREYRKMTKGVDNVRIRFPEDSIAYQMKQLNRHLIAIGQFLLSIFAGFLFGFRGVEWIVGNLDFGFRLLLGVMCALVIALAEIYFLAKKLNEELSVPETVQIGGPPKYVDKVNDISTIQKTVKKEHQD